MLSFPFETITDATRRNAVMARVLEYFELAAPPTMVELILDNDDGPGVYTETGAWTTATVPGYNGTSYRFATVGTAATAKWQFLAHFDGFAQIFVQYRTASNRAASAAYKIDAGSGIQTASANQAVIEDNLTWKLLGIFEVQSGLGSITLDAQMSAGGSVIIADAVRLRLSVARPVSDFNGDAVVDGADFLAWQRGLGASAATPGDGDADNDADVDADDLIIWNVQFGDAVQGIDDVSTVAFTTLEDQEPQLSSGEMAALAHRVRDLLFEDVGRRRVRIVERLPRSDTNSVSVLEAPSRIPSPIEET
jgi:hypothetical protein